jgi:hypothetical protein
MSFASVALGKKAIKAWHEGEEARKEDEAYAKLPNALKYEREIEDEEDDDPISNTLNRVQSLQI